MSHVESTPPAAIFRDEFTVPDSAIDENGHVNNSFVQWMQDVAIRHFDAIGGRAAEKDAKEKGIEVDSVTVPLSTVDRAILDGADEGFLRVHLKKGTDHILGATLVAEHAGDMIGELCLAITHKIGLGKIASVIHPYPTQGEVIKKAADTWRRGKLTPGVKKLFQRWFRVFS